MWFDRDYSRGIQAMLPELGNARRMMNLLRAEAELAVEAGDGDAAVEPILQIFAVADALSNEPTLIGHLVRVSVVAAATSAVRHVLDRTTLSEESLLKLQKRVQQARQETSLRRVFIGERVVGQGSSRWRWYEAEKFNRTPAGAAGTSTQASSTAID